MAYPDPQILVCVLGEQLDRLVTAAREFRAATTFTVDEEYSTDEPDDRMESSFDVCWDTVHPDARDDDDEQAVADHAAVMYALSPPLPRATILQGGSDAVMFIEHLLARGATAAKIENAGIAHGVARWRTLAAGIRKATDHVARVRAVRLAVAKRPLGGDRFYESLGHHLIGLPEVYVPIKSVGSDRESVAVMDRIADELAADGVDAVVARHRARLDLKSEYEGGFEFKINPYGIVKLPLTPVAPALRPSRPGI